MELRNITEIKKSISIFDEKYQSTDRKSSKKKKKPKKKLKKPQKLNTKKTTPRYIKIKFLKTNYKEKIKIFLHADRKKERHYIWGNKDKYSLLISNNSK